MPGKSSLCAATLAAAVSVWLVSGCGNDEPAGVDTPGDMTETTTTQPDTPQYFATPDHLGENVTVTAAVDSDLTDESVVLDAGSYGDDSLLVLFRGDRKEFGEGTVVTVTGTVRQFSYDGYADEYGLGEAALFEVYADEEFLVADSIAVNGGGSPQPTAPTS